VVAFELNIYLSDDTFLTFKGVLRPKKID